jgi:hypothetical protein
MRRRLAILVDALLVLHGAFVLFVVALRIFYARLQREAALPQSQEVGG